MKTKVPTSDSRKSDASNGKTTPRKNDTVKSVGEAKGRARERRTNAKSKHRPKILLFVKYSVPINL